MISPTNRAVCWKQNSLTVLAEPSEAFPTTLPGSNGLPACPCNRDPKAYCWGRNCRERMQNLEHVHVPFSTYHPHIHECWMMDPDILSFYILCFFRAPHVYSKTRPSAWNWNTFASVVLRQQRRRFDRKFGNLSCVRISNVRKIVKFMLFLFDQ